MFSTHLGFFESPDTGLAWSVTYVEDINDNSGELYSLFELTIVCGTCADTTTSYTACILASGVTFCHLCYAPFPLLTTGDSRWVNTTSRTLTVYSDTNSSSGFYVSRDFVNSYFAHKRILGFENLNLKMF